MSKKKRAKEKQKKQNSAEYKKKQAKKSYYRSAEASRNWDKKKEKKRQSQLTQRESNGVSQNCPLESWDNPSLEKCEGCDIKCSFNTSL